MDSHGTADTRSELKNSFIAARRFWTPFWDRVMDVDTEYFARYSEFSSYPWRHGVLEPKVREFMYIAIDASPAHMFETGVRFHMLSAAELGATPDELMEVLEIISTVGLRTGQLGFRVLAEELGEAGTSTNGDGADASAVVARMAPGFHETSRRLQAHCERGEHVDAKTRELILLAVCASVASLDEDGTREHIRGALSHGARKEEILEVLQLASVLGVHAINMGLATIEELLGARSRNGTSSAPARSDSSPT